MYYSVGHYSSNLEVILKSTLHYLCIILSRVSTLLRCGTNPITKLKIAISLKSKTNLQS